ncbi:GlxA family transcriptional regulator [Streptosporangiaceae bacterium NEAU-GS5]|nr:GlxA family transcriptional regulator [Streptosporangiaceae bacterium NEAU-GS5]
MQVLIVLFDGVQSLDVTGPMEVFAGAARLGGPYAVTTAGPGGRPIRTTSGLTLVPDAALESFETADMVLVPGGEGSRAPAPAVVAWLAAHGPAADRVVSVCTGAFLLGEAGLLDGRRATTHWAYCATLARRFPSVTVESDPIFVRDGNVYTSAGVTAGIDLALAIVEEDLGRDAALTIARHLVVFLRRPGNQAQFSAPLAAQTASRDSLRDVQRWIVEHPEADLSVEALAGRASLSPRQFARAFRAEIGVSPGRYVDRVRLEAARRLLEDTGDSVEHVARSTGYGTSETLRRALTKALGVSPTEYRRRFTTPA